MTPKMPPLPIPRDMIAQMDADGHITYKHAYTADQMRAYALQVAEECARICEERVQDFDAEDRYTSDVPWEAESLGGLRMAKELAATIRTRFTPEQ